MNQAICQVQIVNRWLLWMLGGLPDAEAPITRLYLHVTVQWKKLHKHLYTYRFLSRGCGVYSIPNRFAPEIVTNIKQIGHGNSFVDINKDYQFYPFTWQGGVLLNVYVADSTPSGHARFKQAKQNCVKQQWYISCCRVETALQFPMFLFPIENILTAIVSSWILSYTWDCNVRQYMQKYSMEADLCNMGFLFCHFLQNGSW